MKKYICKSVFFCCSLTVFMLQSCFTGVENTGKITLSKKELTAVAPTQEDLYLSSIENPVLKNWRPGRSFVVSDNKINFILETKAPKALNEGDTIIFDHSEGKISVDGGERTILVFNAGGEKIEYPIEKPKGVADTVINANNLPLLIDLQTIDVIDKKLKGQSFWTKSTLWYDDNLQYKKGKKFTKITVSEVRPGNNFFPAIIKFEDEEGDIGSFLLSLGLNGTSNRTFGRLFSLEDPRSKYKNISTEIWGAIQKEELKSGMTKEETRLSRGNPSDVEMGHNYSNSLEIWYYPDGSYVRFIDGLLLDYK